MKEVGKVGLVCVVAALWALVWVPSAWAAVVYDEDFSSDPGWNTNAPDNIYWKLVLCPRINPD